MKFILSLILIGVFTFFLSTYAPWWICGVIAFAICLVFKLGPGMAFLVGFLGVALTWGIQAQLIDNENQGVLSRRIGELFMGISSLAVIAITALIGGLVGGFGGMTGGSLSRLLFPPKSATVSATR